MDDPISQAKQQISTIDAQLSALGERKQKLQEFVRLAVELSLAQPGSQVGTALLPVPRSLPLPPLPPQFMIESDVPLPKPMKEQILEMSAVLLEDGFPEKTAKLVQMLESVGIKISGRDKIQTVSAILGKDPRFIANRKFGWSYQDQKPTPDAATSGSGG